MQPIHPAKKRQPVKTIISPDGTEHNFYRIEYADEILHARFMVAEIQELYIRFGISEGFLAKTMDILINEALSNNDISSLKQNVIAVAQNLQGRMGRIAERTMYEELACVYFMMDDEPADYDPDWQAKKKAVWRSAGEVDFFTLEAFRHINNSTDISASDILAVWKAVDERIAQLETSISL